MSRLGDDAGEALPRLDDDVRGAIVVVVTRSGGIAGIRRRWRVVSVELTPWVALIEGCPWDESVGVDAGADRFVWTIDARNGNDQRRAELPDSDLQGPWRTLVDEVRVRGDAQPIARPSAF